MTRRKSSLTIPDPIVSRLDAVIRCCLPDYNHLIAALDSPSGFPEFGRVRINLFNERTIAHFFDVRLEQSLAYAPLLTPHLLLSECKFEYNLSTTKKETANNEVGPALSDNKKLEAYKVASHSAFIPDTIISATIPSSVSPIIYCIEYKRDSHYQYIKLALDYLKYKYYSSGFASPSVFVYVLFYTKPTALDFKGHIELRRNLKDAKRYTNKSLFYTTLPTIIPSSAPTSDPDSATTPSTVSTSVPDSATTPSTTSTSDPNSTTANQDPSFVQPSNPPFSSEILSKIGKIFIELSQLEAAENLNKPFIDIDFPKSDKNYAKINRDSLLGIIDNDLRELAKSLNLGLSDSNDKFTITNPSFPLRFLQAVLNRFEPSN